MTDREIFEAMLGECWSALGGDMSLLQLVDLVGDPAGLLPSKLAAMPSILAAVAASTLAAATLDSARTGRASERVSINCEHVALAARSERFARKNGQPQVNLFDPMSAFFETADGWVRLHANYPWHRERALAVLDCPAGAQSVAQAVRKWRSSELEDALAHAGALGSAVRTRQDWESHPQGRAAAELPLLQSSTTQGQARQQRTGRAAQGVKILDLTRVIAGPVATRTLSAWGADVLRLDSPHRAELESMSIDTLSGKRSAGVDFAMPDGRHVLDDLLTQADVLVQGYRPGALTRFELAESTLAERYPHLTNISLSAWGPVGPWRNRRGFDSLVQCSTGIASIEGSDTPGVLPAQLLDHGTGYIAAAAIMLALAEAQHGGNSRSVQVSLAQTANWVVTTGIRPREPERTVDPGKYSTTLSGAHLPIEVIEPPGIAGDLHPRWAATTELGADAPVFLSS